MVIIDIIIILFFIYGAYLGYQRGFIKELNDFIILFISSFFAGRISDFLFGVFYKFFPFFNFLGKSEGLKSINIILWKLILYILIIVIILVLIKKVYMKFKIENKIIDSMVETTTVTKVLGVIMSVPLMVVLMFDVILFSLSPNFNLTSVNKSKLASAIIKSTPVLSKENINLYRNQKYIIERINEDDNTIENYKAVNDDIIKNIVDTKLVSEDKIEKLEMKNKLLGNRRSKEEKTEETKEETEENNDNSSNSDEDEDDEAYYEEGNYDEDEEYEDEYDEEYYEEDFSEEYEDEDYCSDFPEDC